MLFIDLGPKTLDCSPEKPRSYSPGSALIPKRRTPKNPGWWFQSPWKLNISQLGWLFPPNIWENKKCSKPPTRTWFFSVKHAIKLQIPLAKWLNSVEIRPFTFNAGLKPLPFRTSMCVDIVLPVQKNSCRNHSCIILLSVEYQVVLHHDDMPSTV